MNQRLSYSEAAPGVYKAMLALQASVDKSGFEKDLMDLCACEFHIEENTSVHTVELSRCLRFWRLEINSPSLKPRFHLMASHSSTSPATFESQRIIAIFTKLLALISCLIQRGANQMHLTYASPGAADYYRRNKKFADGTVLVKEVFGTDHAQMTTGDAHWAKDTKVWFVLIKDSKDRYPHNPLWGDGWGWALFKSDAPNKQVATDYKKDCLGCHTPAKTDDWIYVKGYPVLHGE